MRFDKISNMLFLNDLNLFKFDFKYFLLRFAFPQKVDDNIIKTFYICDGIEKTSFK